MGNVCRWRGNIKRDLKEKGQKNGTGFTCFMTGSTWSGAHANTLMHLSDSCKTENLSCI
jgi:hypothetical protein